ncbi:MAG: AAA family ATPase, partial [Myxococcales bacterium]|nr:AAA family ATPase [Myxococcales bacterium]
MVQDVSRHATVELPGLTDAEAPLYRGSRTTTWRMARADGSRLFKVTNDPSNLSHVAALREEIKILEDRGRSCEALASGEDATALGYMVPDPGGEPLAQRIPAGGLAPAQAVAIAITLTKILHELHARRVIHKDLNPANVLYDPATGSVDLISLDICSRVPSETSQLVHPGYLEGDLAYISPEQTGRMNRLIDYRSDFYSLGALLYQMLCGAPPFRGRDPVELVHGHIARKPPTLAEVAAVPAVLSKIVARLLAKNAEDRYQSAAGLLADLQTCAEALAAGPEIPDFELARSDALETLQIPQKLYGREDDVKVLMSAFERVSAGRAELVLVSGYSGIGKTALVGEIHIPITQRNGFFIGGKFDQYRRNIPYHAFAVAGADLVRQLLTESAAGVAAWKLRLRTALGENAPLMTELIPELALVLGSQPPAPELTPVESEARFNTALTRFFEVFAGEEPMVVFLDDLQWADAPSLKLVRHIATQAGALRLMLIGAYRDNEVGPSHPLQVAIDELAETELPITRIVLGPLSPASVRTIVADTLNCDDEQDEQAQQLATILLEKTDGNPFFLRRLVEQAAETGAVRFDADAGGWAWDEGAVRALAAADNVVDLLQAELRDLEPEARALLAAAALLGDTFDVQGLVYATGRAPAALAPALVAAIDGRFVRPLDADYWSG